MCDTNEPEKSVDTLYDVRLELSDVVEELGSVFSLVREAICDFDNSNARGANLVAEDAANGLTTIERKCSELSAQLSRWVAFGKQRA